MHQQERTEIYPILLTWDIGRLPSTTDPNPKHCRISLVSSETSSHKKDLGMSGDRNESQTQLFSPSFLCLTVAGRFIGKNMASKQGESSSSWTFALFGEMSSYRI